jgi:hypothetical protein
MCGFRTHTLERTLGGTHDRKAFAGQASACFMRANRCFAIMTDDTGFGVFSTFGGVPNLDRVAANGLRYKIVRRQMKCLHVVPFFQKRPPCLVYIVASASSYRRGGASVRQGYGYVDQQHHEPNQQYKGEQSPAEARERFYDEMLELWWKFHRSVPRSHGDGRDHS